MPIAADEILKNLLGANAVHSAQLMRLRTHYAATIRVSQEVPIAVSAEIL